MKKLSFAGLKGRVSWGSVFGGVMTVLAISVLLSILNSSIGLFMSLIPQHYYKYNFLST